jgi:hypothetical protein
MVERRRDIIKLARMANKLDFGWPTDDRAGDANINAMVQGSPLGTDAQIVLSLLPVLSMAAVAVEDPGA